MQLTKNSHLLVHHLVKRPIFPSVLSYLTILEVRPSAREHQLCRLASPCHTVTQLLPCYKTTPIRKARCRPLPSRHDQQQQVFRDMARPVRKARTLRLGNTHWPRRNLRPLPNLFHDRRISRIYRWDHRRSEHIRCRTWRLNPKN